MSYKIIDNDYPRCREWMKAIKQEGHCDEIAIGLERNGELISVAAYGKFNGGSIHCHFARKPGARLTKAFIWFCFYYPFVHLGAVTLIGFVDSTNLKIIRLLAHAGFKLEHTIDKAAVNGDLLIFTMTKKQCKYMKG